MIFSRQNFSFKKAIFPALLFSLTVGCGLFKDRDGEESPDVARDESKAGDYIENGAKEYNLMGSWESDCKGSDLFKAHKREIYKFEGDIFTHVDRYYVNNENNCEGETAFTVLYEGNFKIKSKNDDLDARNVDFSYKKSYITAHADGGIKLLNSLKSCGVDNWEKHKKQDLGSDGGTPTCPTYKMPQERFDVVKIENDKLILGHSSGLTLPKSRPSGLDYKNIFKKH